MNRRTTVRISAVSALVLGLAACGGDDGGGSASGGGGGGGGGDYEVAFVQGVAGDEFYITMQCGIEAAAEELGVTVTTQGPQQFDPALQTPIVDSVVASQPDGLLIAPTDVSAMNRPIRAAADAGITVGLVDTTLEDPSMAVTQVASDNEGGGAAAFEAIKQANPDGGTVLVVGHEPGISTNEARIKGFNDALAQDPAFTALPTQYAQNDPAEGARIVTSTLQAHPDLIGIFGTNLFAAEGAATGLRQAGATGVTVVGFDAGPAQVEALQNGTVQALVAQQPADIGRQGLEQVVASLNGEEPQAEIQTGFTILTQDNLDQNQDAVYRSDC
ncbi:ABC transporter substrate-binding protein [Geodermatophilus poikilotrophus]|uniref:Monosaccharide ABC transporter substrate-binding protein, CUT2 family n=1 Tax=Geodermatophilus poikilotrophus TaxID=1333667 RepID=A0A1H9ZXT7_9ACTN|nr:ABC transporter substrate-binding protein [Geodermatophilus poikilotrophus]SES86161.1 monosaccharide ABC transporter substrate-binding protein, CUT2 family [Geodermatophilus poikilotrophus]